MECCIHGGFIIESDEGKSLAWAIAIFQQIYTVNRPALCKIGLNIFFRGFVRKSFDNDFKVKFISLDCLHRDGCWLLNCFHNRSWLYSLNYGFINCFLWRFLFFRFFLFFFSFFFYFHAFLLNWLSNNNCCLFSSLNWCHLGWFHWFTAFFGFFWLFNLFLDWFCNSFSLGFLLNNRLFSNNFLGWFNGLFRFFWFFRFLLDLLHNLFNWLNRCLSHCYSWFNHSFLFLLDLRRTFLFLFFRIFGLHFLNCLFNRLLLHLFLGRSIIRFLWSFLLLLNCFFGRDYRLSNSFLLSLYWGWLFSLNDWRITFLTGLLGDLLCNHCCLGLLLLLDLLSFGILDNHHWRVRWLRIWVLNDWLYRHLFRFNLLLRGNNCWIRFGLWLRHLLNVFDLQDLN